MEEPEEPGYCPVCQGVTVIRVLRDDDGLIFTCVRHPQFSHRLVLDRDRPIT